MTRTYSLLPLFLVIAITIGIAMCSGGNSRAATQTSDRAIRECPEAHQFDSSTVAESLLTSGTSGIPEYNDCQRFIEKGRFGALYAIFATHPKTVELGPKVAVLVAVIRSWGDTYPALNIKPGLNCVYLSGDRRFAQVVDSASFYPCCPIIALKQLPAPFLESRVTVAKGFTSGDDYPQVARWDWDEKNGHQYMGVKCDIGWCEIGPTGFVQSAAWTPVATLPYRMRRNMMIKGWYDEQNLAGAAATPGAIPPVSGITGTIFPDSAVADYTDATFQDHKWHGIAYVAMPTKSPKYVEKMGFGATPANPATPLHPNKFNKIEFCVGTTAECEVPTSVPCPAAIPSTAAIWGWSRTTPIDGGQPKYRCVVRWSNEGMTSTSGVPVVLFAAARWRWIATDETSWTKCSAGCCEVH